MENDLLIRCIVVDDEHPAMRLLSSYIKKTAGLQLVLQTKDPYEALAAINKGLADLIFLDIQMPEMTGIELMKALRNNNTKIVLTTAYPNYALDGYHYDVIDYLLKPITFDRFLIAVVKAKERISHLLPSNSIGHIMVKMEYRVHKIDYNSIQYIEAQGDYAIFNTIAGKLMTLERMKNLESILPPSCFMRIHKSYIINTTHIEYLEKSKIVIAGKHLPIGEVHKHAVRARFAK